MVVEGDAGIRDVTSYKFVSVEALCLALESESLHGPMDIGRTQKFPEFIGDTAQSQRGK